MLKTEERVEAKFWELLRVIHPWAFIYEKEKWRSKEQEDEVDE